MTPSIPRLLAYIYLTSTITAGMPAPPLEIQVSVRTPPIAPLAVEAFNAQPPELKPEPEPDRPDCAGMGSMCAQHVYGNTATFCYCPVSGTS
ncbi:hypothetical protein BJY00DRAFT_68822 [Aspergillus carlsbadensis]|nr:hypothetical protein BJY00DRAFT_68822 [Aspergillus carlsbadensis]